MNVMKLPASSEVPNDRTDTPDLQEVLTRCIDSARCHSQAAVRMQVPDLSAMLGEVAFRREGHARELAGLIRCQGGQPKQGPGVAGALRRGWLSVLRTLAGEPARSAVAECLRNEEVLLAAVERALDSQQITHGHAASLRITREDVTTTIDAFRSVVRAPVPEFGGGPRQAAFPSSPGR